MDQCILHQVCSAEVSAFKQFSRLRQRRHGHISARDEIACGQVGEATFRIAKGRGVVTEENGIVEAHCAQLTRIDADDNKSSECTCIEEVHRLRH